MNIQNGKFVLNIVRKIDKLISIKYLSIIIISRMDRKRNSDSDSDSEYEDSQVSILNVFTAYYQKSYKKENISMLDEIKRDDYWTGTSHMMELFYTMLYNYKLYKTSNPDMIEIKDVGTIKAETCDELYGLYLNNQMIKICKTLLPLIIYIVEENLDRDSWNIVNLKLT